MKKALLIISTLLIVGYFFYSKTSIEGTDEGSNVRSFLFAQSGTKQETIIGRPTEIGYDQGCDTLGNPVFLQYSSIIDSTCCFDYVDGKYVKRSCDGVFWPCVDNDCEVLTTNILDYTYNDQCFKKHTIVCRDSTINEYCFDEIGALVECPVFCECTCDSGSTYRARYAIADCSTILQSVTISGTVHPINVSICQQANINTAFSNIELCQGSLVYDFFVVDDSVDVRLVNSCDVLESMSLSNLGGGGVVGVIESGLELDCPQYGCDIETNITCDFELLYLCDYPNGIENTSNQICNTYAAQAGILAGQNSGLFPNNDGWLRGYQSYVSVVNQVKLWDGTIQNWVPNADQLIIDFINNTLGTTDNPTGSPYNVSDVTISPTASHIKQVNVTICNDVEEIAVTPDGLLWLWTTTGGPVASFSNVGVFSTINTDTISGKTEFVKRIDICWNEDGLVVSDSISYFLNDCETPYSISNGVQVKCVEEKSEIALPSGLTKCAIIGTEKEKEFIEIQQLVDEQGNISWANCQTGEVIESFEFISCECDVNITTLSVCEYASDGTCIRNFDRFVVEISNCSDEGREETDYVSGTNTILTPPVDPTNDVEPCIDCANSLTQGCFICEPKPAISTSIPIKEQVKSLSKRLSTTSEKTASKTTETKKLGLKFSSTTSKSCIYGTQVEVMFLDDGTSYSVNGELNAAFDSTGYKRVDCEVEVKSPDQNVCVVNEVCVKTWETVFGEICPNNDFPEGKKVWWKEGTDCNGNTVYPNGVDTATYFTYGEWAATEGAAPPTLETLGGCDLAEGLSSAQSNSTCTMTESFVTGFSFGQTWVNFQVGDVITGTFATAYTLGSGDEIAFQSKWSTNQLWQVELLVNGSYSTPVSPPWSDWTAIGQIADNYQFDANCATGAGNPTSYLLKMSFSDFGVTSGDLVTGIRVTFLAGGSNDPDFTGAYITTNALVQEPGGAISYTGEVLPVGCCAACITENIEVAACSSVDNAEVNINDPILTVYDQDCNGNISNLSQYLVENDGSLTLLIESVQYESCDLEVVRTQNCIRDSLGIEWTEISVFNTALTVNITTYINKKTKQPGTPSGSFDSWEDCTEVSGDFEQNRACGIYNGQDWDGYRRSYFDAENGVITQYVSLTDETPLVGVVEFCCDDCTQVSGCYGGRGTRFESFIANGDTVLVQDLVSDGDNGTSNDVAATIELLYGGVANFDVSLEICGNVDLNAITVINANADITEFLIEGGGTIAMTKIGNCALPYSNECYQSRIDRFIVDNRGMSWTTEWQINVVWSDGSTNSFIADGSTAASAGAGYTEQVTELAAGLATVNPKFEYGIVATYARAAIADICPAEIIPVEATATALSGAGTLGRVRVLPLIFTEGQVTENYYCLPCGEAPTLGECEISCSRDFPNYPELAEPNCTQQILDGCDNGNGGQSVTIVATICPDGRETEYYTDATLSTEYTPVGAIVNCITGQPVEPTVECSDFEYVGVLYQMTNFTPGVTVDFWVSASNGGNAATHDNPSVIWSDFNTHVNGAPDQTIVNPSYSFSDSGIGNFPNDQYRSFGYVYIEDCGLLRDNNTNTGERIQMWLDGVAVLENTNDDTPLVDGSRGVPSVNNPYPIDGGIHSIGFLESDVSAFGGMDLEVSYDGGTTWENVQASTTPPSFECVPLIKCKDTGIILHAVTGDAITVSDMDLFCEPSNCSENTSSGGGPFEYAIETPGGTTSNGTAINDIGTVVGTNIVASITLCGERGGFEVSFDNGATWTLQVIDDGCRSWSNGDESLLDVSLMQVRGLATNSEIDIHWENQ